MNTNVPPPKLSASPLVTALRRFNRKERFCLLEEAVGQSFKQLDPKFLTRLENLLEIEVPRDAWWAFDYHIDWLFGALLTLANQDKPIDKIDPQPNQEGHVTGTVGDFDLVIAFDTTLILAEAKTEAWSNEQMKKKITRLAALPFEEITPNLVLLSPKEPINLQFKYWPKWTLKGDDQSGVFWLKLPFMEDVEEPLAVSRCDKCGNSSLDGDHWKIYPL